MSFFATVCNSENFLWEVGGDMELSKLAYVIPPITVIFCSNDKHAHSKDKLLKFSADFNTHNWKPHDYVKISGGK